MKKYILIVTMIAGVFLAACEKESNENETKISTNSSQYSHNTGVNCMTCHISGGQGEGWFTAAGSVYDSTLIAVFPNATVNLTTAANGGGTLVKSIEVDAFGNFYTTEDISFGTGLYPSVVGINGEVGYMATKITDGQCNACHGNTRDNIWIQ
jgi:mono/diheme cytochrome c family protein